MDLIDQQITGFQVIFPPCRFISTPPVNIADCRQRNFTESIVENLLNNAGRYAQTQVQITLRADSEGVAVIIDDDGNGLEDAQIPHG